jgi:hypothetical protein
MAACPFQGCLKLFDCVAMVSRAKKHVSSNIGHTAPFPRTERQEARAGKGQNRARVVPKNRPEYRLPLGRLRNTAVTHTRF